MSKAAPVDRMFSPAGLAVFLTTPTEGSRRWGTGPSIHVSVGQRGVVVDSDDLTCSDCSGPVDPPTGRPARFLALNKALNSGETRCLACMDDRPDADSAQGVQADG